MSDLEGVYRHDGSTLSWDAAGLTVEAPGARTLKLSWLDVRGARQLPGRDDEIQILVLPRRGRTALDVLDVTVNSIHDANRLVTTINWSAGARSDQRRAGRWARRRGHR